MLPLVINCDLDGVVFDFNGRMTPALERKGHTCDQGQWNFGIERDEFLPIFDRKIREGLFFSGESIPGAVEALNYLKDAGHRVRLVTSKIFPDPDLTTIAQQDTLSWLREQGLHGFEVVFTGNGYAKQGYPADVVVDDKPTLEWRQDRPSTLNILFDQPWNRSVSNKELMDSDVIRAYGWNDVLRGIEGHVIVV